MGEVAWIAAAAAFLGAQWLYAASAQFAVVGVVLFVLGLAGRVGAGAADPAPRQARAVVWWVGLPVVAVATALKMVDLGAWPEHLNAYSAETGWWGILTLEGVWPRDWLRGVEYDLVNGGRSPLHLPLTWLTVRLAGGTVFAVRFAEVLASTALLLVFWQWLRLRLNGWWSVAALTVFALSPWHLAQSRMGTFFSASVAVGLTMLWAADRLDQIERGAGAATVAAPRRLALWAVLGLSAGLVGYAYAPLKVLYLFFAVVWLVLSAAAWRRRRPGWWGGPVAALLLFAVVFALQIGIPPRFEQMFRRDFGPLATDTSIWHKTTDGVVTAEAQPPAVVLANAAANLVEWWRATWSEEGILVWYAPALAVAVPAAALLVWRAATWVPALYLLIGAIPPLMIYPVQRRTLVLWPLVYVAGVVAGRELAAACGRLIDRAWWRATTGVVFVGFAALAAVHGLAVYAKTNSIVGVGSYFGPDYQLEMLREAERLLPSCRVYFVNPTFEDQIVSSVQLYESARRADSPIEFVDFSPGDEPPSLLRDRPLCLFLLERDDPVAGVGAEAVMSELGEGLAGSMLLRRWAGDGSDTLQYVLVMVAAAAGEEQDGVEVAGDAEEPGS